MVAETQNPVQEPMRENAEPCFQFQAMTLIGALTGVTEAVSHKKRLKSTRYFVWQEDGANDLSADGGHAESAVTGSLDLYTKLEFDPWVSEMGTALTNAGIAWALVSVEVEEDTGFTHYSWDWEVA